MSARTQPIVTAAGVTGQNARKSRAPRASRGTAPAARRRSAVVTNVAAGPAKSIEPAPAPVLLDRDQYPPHLQWPETLYDTDVVGHNKEFDAKLADASAVIHAWAESVECGDIESVTPEATEAAEWIRQALTAKIDKNDKDLAVHGVGQQRYVMRTDEDVDWEEVSGWCSVSIWVVIGHLSWKGDCLHTHPRFRVYPPV